MRNPRNPSRRGRFLVPVLMLLAFAVLLPGAAMARQDSNADESSPSRRGPSETLRKEISEREAKLDRGEEKTGGSELRIARDPEGNPYVAGQLIVSYKKGATGPTARAAVAATTADARVEEDFPEIDAAVLSVPEAENERSGEAREANLERARQALEADPNVEAVDYNYVGQLQAATNDPLVDRQWGLSRIKAPRAWGVATGVDTVIAVLDSGAQMNHPDLNGAYLDQWDYFHNDAVGEDDMGHGTHVSGVAAAFTNNGRGIAGTAPDAFLFNYKVCTKQGCPFSAQIPAITDAADMGADVINMSLAGYGRSDAQARAVNYAWNSGTVVVAAAGNDATNQPAYPAAYTNAIAVSGTDYQNGDSDFSNYGTWVDVAAPAGELQGTLSAPRYQILSTYPTYFDSTGYVSLSGTSFAAPMASGVAALLASQNRSAAQIRQRIQSTATDIGPLGRDNLFGTGLVNAQAAVGNNLSSAGPTDADRRPSAPEHR